MRRNDREVQDRQEIFDILRRCDTIRIAIQGETYPYIIPVSFGLEIMDEKAVIYFHCAKRGLKIDLLKKNANVCVEGDIFLKVEKTAHGITARFESIIGFGKCCFIDDMDEVLHALRLLTARYGYDDYPLDRCAGLQHLLVGKIVLEDITGKRNLSGMMTPADRAVQDNA